MPINTVLCDCSAIGIESISALVSQTARQMNMNLQCEPAIANSFMSLLIPKVHAQSLMIRKSEAKLKTQAKPSRKTADVYMFNKKPLQLFEKQGQVVVCLPKKSYIIDNKKHTATAAAKCNLKGKISKSSVSLSKKTNALIRHRSVVLLTSKN